MSWRIHRRSFLAGAVATAAGAACGDPESFERRVRRARRVAKAYFDGADRSTLKDASEVVTEALAHDVRWLEGPLSIIEAADGKDEALVALADAIRGEFARIELVDVHGWMLAPTEVGLIALLA